MADNARTITDLLANLFQDSQSDGSISAQDLRDLIKTFQIQHAGMYMSASTSSSIATGDVYVKASGTTSALGDSANDFTITSSNRITYDALPTRTVKYHVSVSIQLDSSTVDKALGIAIYKNGSLIAGSKMHGFAGATTAKSTNIVSVGTVSMATSDYVELYVTNVDSTDNITVTKMNFVLDAGVK